jgi:hypothetical protein
LQGTSAAVSSLVEALTSNYIREAAAQPCGTFTIFSRAGFDLPPLLEICARARCAEQEDMGKKERCDICGVERATSSLVRLTFVLLVECAAKPPEFLKKDLAWLVDNASAWLPAQLASKVTDKSPGRCAPALARFCKACAAKEEELMEVRSLCSLMLHRGIQTGLTGGLRRSLMMLSLCCRYTQSMSG